MVRLTQGGQSIYGAPRTRKEKRAYAKTVRVPRYKTDQDYYASRSGPVVTIQEAQEPRHAFGELRQKVLERDVFKCRYCGAILTNEMANIDHVHPFKHGGKTTMGNLVTCCRFCNEAKANQITIKAPGIGRASNPFGKP